jgi:hypothetical protein
MNLKDKLKGLPTIYYLNLDERPDRKQYTEEQYEKYKISNFKRFSASSYQLQNFDEWKNKVILNDISTCKRWRQHLIEVATALSTIDMLKSWLENTTEEYVILMEDDYDLSYIDYWHFDWEYLMNNIPFDWDCIQLGFENEKIIPCYLHPILSGHDSGAALIRRSYAEKLIRLFCVDGKYNLAHKISNWKWSIGLDIPNVTIDYFLIHSGRTYSMPLISVNPDIGSYSVNYVRSDRPDLVLARKAYKKWWTVLRDDYTLEEFFMYGKPNDRVITPREPDIDKYV